MIIFDLVWIWKDLLKMFILYCCLCVLPPSQSRVTPSREERETNRPTLSKVRPLPLYDLGRLTGIPFTVTAFPKGQTQKHLTWLSTKMLPMLYPHRVAPTSQQMYDGVSQAQSDWLGAGNASASARHVLCCDAEQAAALPGQHVLAVAEERVAASIERHVVRVAGRHTDSSTGQTAALPAAFLTHTVGKRERLFTPFKWQNQCNTVRQLHILPCVAVFNDGVVGVVKSTVVVAWTVLWQDTLVTLT